MRIAGKWSRVLVPVVALGTMLALGPVGAASAAVHPDGSARNYALRNSCGGANTNLNWSGSGVSTWGVGWDTGTGTCFAGNTLILYYGRSTNTANDDAWSTTFYSAAGVGYNSNTLFFSSTITYVAEEICSEISCSPLHVFAG